MISAVFLEATGEWSERARTQLDRRATVFDLGHDTPDAAGLRSVQPDIVFVEAEHVTDKAAAALQHARQVCPESITVCVTTEEAAGRARVEGTLQPDFWLLVPASDLQFATQLESVLAYAAAMGRGQPTPPPQVSPPPCHPPPPAAESHAQPAGSLFRAVGRMTGCADPERIFVAYCDAVQEFTRCVSYCLLWRSEDGVTFHVVRAEGLAPVVQATCRLGHTSALPLWLQQQRRVVTNEMLSQLPSEGATLREMRLCGGIVAIPVFVEGSLRGIMVLGPKAVGGAYLTTEMEALYMLSAGAAAAVRQGELHGKLEAQKKYIDQVLSTMASGVITLGLDGNIRVCNPHACEILSLEPEAAIGSDMRALPSPLGDYLHSCMRYGEERSREEVSVLGGRRDLRVSTRRLVGQDGALIGSMMLVEDISAERALAQERRNAARNEVINQFVARFAHELKNPLATINTFIELLPTRFDDPEFQQYCSEHVKRDIHRLDDLVAKLLSLSQSPRLSRELVSVPALLDLAVERAALLDETATESITVSVRGELPMVRVDVGNMASALANLLRYCLGPHGDPVQLSAELQEGPEGERPIAVYISSPAHGTAADSLQQVLEPSYVIDHPDVDLGPSASQRLIESQGGALEAYSQDDRIVFHVSLVPEVPGQADDKS